ncbi:DUF1652 domain-containing protein [Pseudomonas brassicacearum]|uniref:DUF1652 domain-containing protein n=1 Tax=Pseudomonas brassicacearum TaxID=930166 RepID=UPI002882FD87|nr:DUF1652 domain-containing protein [Pseudomonas brassicacearum]
MPQHQTRAPRLAPVLKGVIIELRHLIESAFLPLSCQCRVDPGGSLHAQIFEPVTGRGHDLKATHERQGLHRTRM